MSGVEVERGAQGVATVWLNNPGRLNALSNKMVIGLGEELPRLAADDTCRAIVLRGRGGVFCAGRDLTDLKALQASDAAAIKAMYGHMQKMNEVIYYSPQPVISVIEKICLRHRHHDRHLDRHRARRGQRPARLSRSAPRHHALRRGPDDAEHDEPEGDDGSAPHRPPHQGRGSRAAGHPHARSARRSAWMRSSNDVLEHLSRGSAAAIRKSKQFVRDCETLSYRQGINAATEKHIHGLANPETKAGLAAFAEKRKAGWS